MTCVENYPDKFHRSIWFMRPIVNVTVAIDSYDIPQDLYSLNAVVRQMP